MNQRILELHKQAWIWAEQQDYLDPHEKLIELVIQDCIDIAYRNNNSGEGNVIADSIKQHFGVEVTKNH